MNLAKLLFPTLFARDDLQSNYYVRGKFLSRPAQALFYHEISAEYFPWYICVVLFTAKNIFYFFDRPKLQEQLTLTNSEILTDKFITLFALYFQLYRTTTYPRFIKYFYLQNIIACQNCLQIFFVKSRIGKYR